MQQSRRKDADEIWETGVEIAGPDVPGRDEILSAEACAFVAGLERRFGAERRRLLEARAEFQARVDAGENPAFRPETRAIRESDWTIAGTPGDLADRRVEITGPVDRKMIINALNCGASCFMADFEDAASPTFEAMIAGQINLRDAARRTIGMTDPKSGKSYALGDEIATLIVRPRGWHLEEAHLLVDGEPVSASLFDFGLFFFHNAAELGARGSGPYFYLPKMEHYEEAALWNAVFVAAQEELDLPICTIKATVLIETITAAFEMDEILHALKDHIVGLNCGRWDYIFSVIKTFRNRADCVLPDRGLVTMTQPFMRAYSRLLIKTCHRRGAHAMGGMAAQIPIKGDDRANEQAFGKVRADKEREAGDGHDGTWVAHPGLVPVAREVFDRLMPEPNQVSLQLGNVTVTEADLIAMPEGAITEEGLRNNIRVGIQYIEAWLAGRGAVPLYNLMEDAATAEISRAQIWQWMRHGASLADGRAIDRALVDRVLAEEIAALREALGEDRFEGGHFDDAIALFTEVATADDFPTFLTLPAYQVLNTIHDGETAD
ncbi:MAG: malate synthase A [Rhodospirillales bacterium]|nr:malate synthase A [Rhodospirillales bacterium]MDE0380570.1 malate synthase A [Rhodospirillales bacterium]